MVRILALQAVLVAMAVGEALAGGVSQVFFARRASERVGRTWDQAYHELAQDFGFYNFALAALLVVAAVDPLRNAAIIWVSTAMYVVHGVTHVLRHYGFHYGGGAAVATRPRRLDLKQGAMLLVAAALVIWLMR